jgi:hypothetical protein
MANDFSPGLSWLPFLVTADNVSTIVLDPVVIDDKSTNKNSHLEEEVSDTAYSSHQAKVFKSGYVCE